MSEKRRNFEEEEDDEWLFDSIIGYLSSPIWKAPIEHFFEQNCTIFSPEDDFGEGARVKNDSDDESMIPAEYLEAHIKYKNLVDALINSFLQDIGVTYKQFLRACKKSSRFTQQPIYLELFEQIWATENINIFKSQMIKKNVELELQALILLQFQLGFAKKLNEPGSEQINDDEIMAMVIRKSKDEYDSYANIEKASSRRGVSPPVAKFHTEPITVIDNKSQLDTAKKIVFEADHIEKSLQNEIDQQAYLNRKIVKQELKNPSLEPSLARPVSAAKRPVSARKNLNDHVEKLNVNDYPRASSRMNQEAEPSSIVNTMAQAYLNNGNTSEAEIKRRAEFMEKQRQLLTEKKRVERQKQLESYMRQGNHGEIAMNARPMSSRAARSILKGTEPEEIPQSALNTKSISDEERKRNEVRRTLAETLKKEVINQSKK